LLKDKMNTVSGKNCPRETPLYGRFSAAILRRMGGKIKEKGAILQQKTAPCNNIIK
jgi:hypothetical protein